MPRIPGGRGLWSGIGVYGFSVSAGHAHLTVEGVGDVTNGALHPFVSPAHVLILLGLGLLLGQQIPLDLKAPVRIFAAGSAAALLFTLSGKVSAVPQPVLIAVALLMAVPVVLELKLSRFSGAALCGVAAGAVGLDSAVDSAPMVGVLKTLLGTWLAINGAVFYIAVCASHAAGRQWARVGIRVLGSWIIAIALMVLAFSLRKSA